MTIIYILIFCGALSLEVSPRCNTRNILKKLRLTLIMLGALLALAHKHNLFIEIGVCSYLIAEITQNYNAIKTTYGI